MTCNPYQGLSPSSFWKTGVAQENPFLIEGIYQKKFDILPTTKIAAAGSCFAQHISRHLTKNGYRVLDVEPPPPGLTPSHHQRYGYSMYSGRYGNIYTVRQLLQLVQEVAGERQPHDYVWEKDGRFFDALRPAVEPDGLESAQDVIDHRSFHTSRLRDLFKTFDLFIFTLGLTEMWVHKESGTVYPTAPGTIAGKFNPEVYKFENAGFSSINSDFRQFMKTMRKLRSKPFNILLTVSPVPLTATASGKHVLVSTVRSKSILRTIASTWSERESIDYFPSYEIITNPRLNSVAYEDNLRSIRVEAVESVMKHFFLQHPKLDPKIQAQSINRSKSSDLADIQCEEALIQAFDK